MAKKTEEEIDLDNLDDLDLDDADFDLSDSSVDFSSTDDDLDSTLDDFDLEDVTADGHLSTNEDSLDDLDFDLEADSDFSDDGDIDTQDLDSADDDFDTDLDLSSLEDELGLAESDRVEAPSVEAIKDVESDDELERELASLGTQIDDATGDEDLDIDDPLTNETTGDALGLDDDDEDAGLPMDDDLLSDEEDTGLGEDLGLDDEAEGEFGADLGDDSDDLSIIQSFDDAEGSLDDELMLDNSPLDTDVETDAIDSEIAAGLEEDFDDIGDSESDLGLDDDGLDDTGDLFSAEIDEPADDIAAEEIEMMQDDLSTDEEMLLKSPMDDEETTLEPFDLEDEEMGLDVDDGEEASLILDESMEIKTIEPESVTKEADEEAMEMLEDLPEDELEADESGLFETELADDGVEDIIELDDTSEKDDFDLGTDLFGEESVDESLIEIGDLDDDIRSGAPAAITLKTREETSAAKIDTGRHEKTAVDLSAPPSAGKTEIIGQEMLFSLPHLLTVEIGKASLKGAEIMDLTYGSVIELDKKLGEPVDIILGNRKIARGEVVQINEEQLGVRITRISN